MEDDSDYEYSSPYFRDDDNDYTGDFSSEESQDDKHLTYLDVEIGIIDYVIHIETLNVFELTNSDNITSLLKHGSNELNLLGVVNDNETNYTVDLYLLKKTDEPQVKCKNKTLCFMYPIKNNVINIRELNFVFRNKYDKILTVWELDDLKYSGSDILKTLTVEKEVIEF